MILSRHLQRIFGSQHLRVIGSRRSFHLQTKAWPPKRSKVVIGMSGGVDSSVAAFLLKRCGYNVVGAFMRNWNGLEETGVCTADADAADAAAVCKHLGIPFHEFNLEQEYWHDVFEPFINAYEAGFTPNPDFFCNREIKFRAFMDRIKKDIGADYLSTGHYANLDFLDDPAGSVVLKCATDPDKDQTFFLSGIPQDRLRRCIFPLGGLYKAQVREIAMSLDLPVANKPESMGVCFVGKRRSFSDFLGNYIDPLPGSFVDGRTEEVIPGVHHMGHFNFTVGQMVKHVRSRDGHPSVPLEERGKKMYVVRKDGLKNTVHIAPGVNHPLLYTNNFSVDRLYMGPTMARLAKQSDDGAVDCFVRIRHRQTLFSAKVQVDVDGDLAGDSDVFVKARVTLTTPMRAVNPGQIAAFYRDDECLGGGTISGTGPTLYHEGLTHVPQPEIGFAEDLVSSV
eukprot:Clim_evm9s141 gene=Clim_evmTU9s141